MLIDGTVAEWLAPWPQSKKVPDSIPDCVAFLSGVCMFSPCAPVSPINNKTCTIG